MCERGLGQRLHSPERTRSLQGYLWIADVKDACRLHGQQDEELFHGWSRWLDDTNAKFLRACNHLPEQLIHGVGVHAGAIRNACPQCARILRKKRVAVGASTSFGSSEKMRRRSWS